MRKTSLKKFQFSANFLPVGILMFAMMTMMFIMGSVSSKWFSLMWDIIFEHKWLSSRRSKTWLFVRSNTIIVMIMAMRRRTAWHQRIRTKWRINIGVEILLLQLFIIGNIAQNATFVKIRNTCRITFSFFGDCSWTAILIVMIAKRVKIAIQTRNLEIHRVGPSAIIGVGIR